LSLQTLQVFGLMPYYLLNNLLSTDNTPPHFGFEDALKTRESSAPIDKLSLDLRLNNSKQ